MKARLPQGMGKGPGNMQSMIKQAQKMQEDMQKAQEELEAKEFTATSGGGAVEAKVSGKKEIVSLTISPDAVDPDDVEMLQDLIISAVNEAMRQVENASESQMNSITNGMNIPGLFLADMKYDALPLTKLIEQFASLPGIGMKSAQRLAYHILTLSNEQVETFSKTLIEAHSKIKNCKICQGFTDEETCPICSDKSRDRSTICVVENPKDISAFEKTREYNGVYHVLHGLISPMDGVGPEQLFIKELLKRAADNDIKEVIMATNPTVEGEATSIYISRLLKPMGVLVTRLAYGIPVGSDLEYADQVTLYKALENRNEI